MMLNKILHTLLMLLTISFFAGCGYHIGFIKHPQIDSLAVAPAVNETPIYNTASEMRSLMCEAIMQDGTYKLSDQKRADAVIYLTVQSAKFADISDASVDNDNEYKPEEWETRVTVSYKVIIPGQGKPLRSGSVTGISRFQLSVDIESSRLRAVRQACYEAARKVVYNIAEGW